MPENPHQKKSPTKENQPEQEDAGESESESGIVTRSSKKGRPKTKSIAK